MATRRRVRLFAFAAVLAGLDLAAKTLAEARLPGASIDLGIIQLRLADNSGVAFSLGARLPAWTVIAATAAITTSIGAYAWRAALRARRTALLAWAAILGGAAANLADRAPDGLVTDYLHTGWWPTFNLADTLLVLGIAALTLTTLRTPHHPREARPEPAQAAAPSEQTRQGAQGS